MSAVGFFAMLRELLKLPQADFEFRMGFYSNSREAFEFTRRARINRFGSDRRIPADEWPNERHWSKEVWPNDGQ